MTSILRSTIGKFLGNHKRSFEAIRLYPAAARKRFYKNVYVTECDGRYEVNLDKRKLKTPMGNILQLPNEALAVAVATEWDMQQDILQQNMHITSLCNTALDNPCLHTKESLADDALQFLAGDTVCFRSNEPPDLEAFQKEHWDPVMRWFKSRYHVQINVCENVSGIPVTDETLALIKKHLLSYNDWCLLGVHFVAENLKSLILTFGIIDHQLDVETAVALSRLETLFQVKHWGNVEWSHDVDKAQTSSRVAAGVLFTYLNQGSTNFNEKTKVSTKEKAEIRMK